MSFEFGFPAKRLDFYDKFLPGEESKFFNKHKNDHI